MALIGVLPVFLVGGNGLARVAAPAAVAAGAATLAHPEQPLPYMVGAAQLRATNKKLRIVQYLYSSKPNHSNSANKTGAATLFFES